MHAEIIFYQFFLSQLHIIVHPCYCLSLYIAYGWRLAYQTHIQILIIQISNKESLALAFIIFKFFIWQTCEVSLHKNAKIPALFAFCSLKIQAHLAKVSLILFVQQWQYDILSFPICTRYFMKHTGQEQRLSDPSCTSKYIIEIYIYTFRKQQKRLSNVLSIICFWNLEKFVPRCQIVSGVFRSKFKTLRCQERIAGHGNVLPKSCSQFQITWKMFYFSSFWNKKRQLHG
jgi:hypothetical protein